MALPTITATCRASFGGSIAGGSSWSNNWHIRRIGLEPVIEADIANAHDAFMTFYQSAVFHSVTAGTTLAQANYTPLDGTSGAFSLTGGLVGDGGTNAAAAQTCEVLTIRTAVRGRQNRGRVYLPAFVEDDWDVLGHISTTAIARVLAAVAVLTPALAGSGWEIGVGSYGPYKNPVTGLLEVGTPHFTPMTSITMDNLSDVQRSRKA